LKIKRFFWVWSPRSRVRHRMFGKSHSEGLTQCGRFVRKGWIWQIGTPQRKLRPLCADCERSAK